MPLNAPKRAKPKRKPWLWIALVAAFGLALALYLLLPAIKRAFPSGKTRYAVEPAPRPTTVATLDAAALTELTVAHEGGESYTLVMRDGALHLLRGDGALPVDADANERFLDAIENVVMIETVAQDLSEVEGHLADMGLAPPRIVATARFSDGSERTLSFGAQLSDTAHYYCLWSGDRRVYLCDASLYQTFEYTSGMLLPVEQPALQKALINRVTVAPRGGEPLTMRFSTDPDGAVEGVLEAPLPYPMDAAAAARIVSAVAGFRLGSVQPALTEGDYARYGFDDPLVVVEAHQQAGSYADVNADGQLVSSEAAEATLRFALGRAEGEFLYTCLYEGACYYVSSFLVTALVGADEDALLTRAPVEMGDSPVVAVDLSVGDRAYALRYTLTERVLPNNQLETDENGDVVYDASATLNGEAISVESYLAFIDRLRLMTVSGDLREPFDPGATAPRWQMTLITEGGARRVVAAYPLDAFTDAIAVDGVARHEMNAEAIAIALAGM